MHRITGAVISGYRVLSAAASEIEKANANLRERGSQFRYVPDQHPPQVQPALQVVHDGGFFTTP